MPITHRMLEEDKANLRADNERLELEVAAWKQASDLKADEIERLRAQVASVLKTQDMMAEEIERLRDERDEVSRLNGKLPFLLDEIERLRALIEDALRGLHNDFEPDNQSALYNRIRRDLGAKP